MARPAKQINTQRKVARDRKFGKNGGCLTKDIFRIRALCKARSLKWSSKLGITTHIYITSKSLKKQNVNSFFEIKVCGQRSVQPRQNICTWNGACKIRWDVLQSCKKSRCLCMPPAVTYEKECKKGARRGTESTALWWRKKCLLASELTYFAAIRRKPTWKVLKQTVELVNSQLTVEPPSKIPFCNDCLWEFYLKLLLKIHNIALPYIVNVDKQGSTAMWEA